MINNFCSRQHVPPVWFHLEVYRDALERAKNHTLTHERPRTEELERIIFVWNFSAKKQNRAWQAPPSHPDRRKPRAKENKLQTRCTYEIYINPLESIPRYHYRRSPPVRPRRATRMTLEIEFQWRREVASAEALQNPAWYSSIFALSPSLHHTFCPVSTPLALGE